MKRLPFYLADKKYNLIPRLGIVKNSSWPPPGAFKPSFIGRRKSIVSCQWKYRNLLKGASKTQNKKNYPRLRHSKSPWTVPVNQISTFLSGVNVKWWEVSFTIRQFYSAVYSTPCKFLTSAVPSGFSLKSEWQQISLGLRNSFKYSCWS